MKVLLVEPNAEPRAIEIDGSPRIHAGPCRRSHYRSQVHPFGRPRRP